MKHIVTSTCASIALSLSGFALVVLFAAPIVVNANDSSQDNDKINICHKTNSDNNPWNAIQVSDDAWSAHQNHGDFLYSGPTSSGNPTNEGDAWCAAHVPTPSPTVINTCPIPDSLGDATHQVLGASYGSEPSVQTILNASGYSLVDAVNDQVEYQVWNVTGGQDITVSPEFLDKYAASNIVFGYYKNGDINTFIPIFKRGNVPGYESTIEAVTGTEYSTSTSAAATIGFAIKASYGSDLRTLATQNSLNVGGYDQAVVYNPSSNEYILGFEDIVNGGDNDYNDMVVSLKLSCKTPETPENPQMCKIYSNTDTKVHDIRINFGETVVVDVPSVLVTPTAITTEYWTADVDGPASTDAKWIWSEDPVQDWTVDKVVSFTRTFNVTDANTSATLTFAVDNYHSVYLDNVLIGFGNTNSFNTPAGETIAIPSLSIGEHTLKFVVQNEAQAGNAVNNPGGLVYALTLHNTSCNDDGGPGGDENNPPTLNLIGDAAITLTIGQTFIDPGAKASDAEDFAGFKTYPIDLTGFTVTGLPPSGILTASTTYTINYKFTDSDGADSNTVVRKVYVIPGTTQCSDALDNDDDDFTDSNDSGCHTDGNVSNINSYDPNDNNENTSIIVDVCLNIDGNQTSAPEGMQVSEGLCAPIDVCPNILGDQTTVPAGQHKNEAGMCVDDTTGGGGDGDVCPETEGIQTSVEECGQGGGDGVIPDEPTGGKSGGSRRSSGGSSFSTTGGLVLGASTECGIYLDEFIKFGENNDTDSVSKLQSFLNEWMGANLPLSGKYDSKTMSAVNAFQLQYSKDILEPWVKIGLHPNTKTPTGYVYRTTQRMINNLVCPALNLPLPNLTDEVRGN